MLPVPFGTLIIITLLLDVIFNLIPLTLRLLARMGLACTLYVEIEIKTRGGTLMGREVEKKGEGQNDILKWEPF